MDKVVDHLLVFKGEGEVKDFPGNYTQYRQWQALESVESSKSGLSGAQDDRNASKSAKPMRDGIKRKMTFKEKREFEQLEKGIDDLEKEKKQIEQALSSGTISVDEITTLSKRLPLLNDELDAKSMRWLELSEIQN
jgi:ATP-binding cassette subfamily F protein uup